MARWRSSRPSRSSLQYVFSSPWVISALARHFDFPAKRSRWKFARGEHPLANRLGGLRRLVAAELLVFDGRSFDMNIDAVEQRSGDAVTIIFHLLR